MKNYTSKLSAFLYVISSVLCTSTYGAEYGRLIVLANSAEPTSQAVILEEGETFTVLQFSTFRDAYGSQLFADSVPFKLELFYDPADYDNPEKIIKFTGLSIGGIYYRENRNSNGGSALTSSESSRTFVGPCKIRILKTVSDQDCYLAYKIIRKPNPQTTATATAKVAATKE